MARRRCRAGRGTGALRTTAVVPTTAHVAVEPLDGVRELRRAPALLLLLHGSEGQHRLHERPRVVGRPHAKECDARTEQKQHGLANVVADLTEGALLAGDADCVPVARHFLMQKRHAAAATAAASAATATASAALANRALSTSAAMCAVCRPTRDEATSRSARPIEGSSTVTVLQSVFDVNKSVFIRDVDHAVTGPWSALFSTNMASAGKKVQKKCKKVLWWLVPRPGTVLHTSFLVDSTQSARSALLWRLDARSSHPVARAT